MSLSSHTHHFSQIPESFNSEPPVGVFVNSRSSKGVAHGEYRRRHKRLKTSGLNSRFDRMIETMDATYCPPSKDSSRHRTRTVSSSSVDTSEISQTPLDAYNNLQEGRLGKDFSVIKMPTSSAHRRDISTPRDTAVSTSSSTNYKTSTDPILPEWLCNTFSTLSAEHPLRLLLPRRTPSSPDFSSRAPTLLDDFNSLTVPESDATCTVSAPPQHSPDRLKISESLFENAEHTNSRVNILKSPYVPQDHLVSLPLPSDGALQQDSGPESGFLPINAVPFSTPGPCALISQQYTSSPTPSRRSAYSSNQIHLTHPIPISNVDELDFIPFLTPGPGSATSPTSDLTHLPVLPRRSDIPLATKHGNSDEPCTILICSTPELKTPHLSERTISSPDKLSSYRLADLGLSPYIAALSDPAPGYSSDDITDYYVYYEDHLTDDSGSDPHVDPSLINAHDLLDLYATPGPAYRPPQPIYFDSPTEDPSDSDPLQPDYEVDYNALDFRWEPYNRKGTDGDKITYNNNQLQLYDLPSNQREPSHNEKGHQTALEITEPHLPESERILSPSPFRFSVHLDDSTSTAPLPTNSDEGRGQPRTPEPQHAAPIFAPAPGIYISPLCNAAEPATSPASSVPKSLAPAFQLDNSENIEQKVPSNSQTSNDSIQSWRDADADDK